MEKKAVLVAFNGDFMCFTHVLLNALDTADRGWEVKVILEGAATGLIPRLLDQGAPLAAKFREVTSRGLLDGACKACCAKTGTLEDAQNAGIVLLGDMAGHPSLGRYLDEGYQVITF